MKEDAMKISTEGRLGLHIVPTPNGRYVFVGSVPAWLMVVVPAEKSDVIGVRAFKDEFGRIMTHKAPSFPSKPDALRYYRHESGLRK